MTQPTAILEALARNRTIDITTTGAHSGEARRIEIWAWLLPGRLFLTGSPGRRDWYANLKATPELTLHLKHGTQVDVPARAHPVEDAAERRAILTDLLAGSSYDLEAWIAGSPLAEVELRP